MHRDGHYGLNALIYAPIGFALIKANHPQLALWGALIVLSTAMVPDWDMKIPLVKHRGITHTVLFAFLIGSVTGGLMSVVPLPYAPSTLGIFGDLMGTLGIIGHFMGDMMTPMGISPFWPLSKRKHSLNWFHANNRIANYGFLLLGGVALLLVFGYGFQQTGVFSSQSDIAATMF